MRGQITKIVNNSAEKIILATSINKDLLFISRSEKNMLISEDETAMGNYESLIKDAEKRLRERIQALSAIAGPGETETLSRFDKAFSGFMSIHADIARLTLANTNFKAAQLAQAEAGPLITSIGDHVQKVLSNYEEEFLEATQLFDSMLLAEVGELMKQSARLLSSIRELENASQAVILSRDTAATQTLIQRMDQLKADLGNLARYIIRAWFSQERMVYIPAEASDDGTAKVVYTSNDRKFRKTFNALDWLARLVTHIPGRYEQTVRYYGYYSNKSRGMRKKAETDDDIPAVIPNEMSSKESRQNWVRLIQKNYEVDPLICPKCWGQMHIISFIEELDIIEKILRHLGLWDIRNHDPPQPVTSDYIPDLVYDFSDSQIPASDYWN